MKIPKIIYFIIIIIVLVLVLAGCSSTPVLYPNQQYKQAGKDQSNQDIKQCTQDADKYLKSPEAKNILKGAATGSIFGAIWGVVWGLISGNIWTGIAAGIAGGAATGAVAGAISPDHLKQNYISTCLSKKGYQVIGWD
jgi:outer membrane lipoprotein SlyB